jgi:hypothetical protein
MSGSQICDVAFGSDSDFLPWIRLAVKAGTRRKRTESGHGLKTTHADAVCKQRRRACTINVFPALDLKSGDFSSESLTFQVDT